MGSFQLNFLLRDATSLFLVSASLTDCIDDVIREGENKLRPLIVTKVSLIEISAKLVYLTFFSVYLHYINWGHLT